MRQWFSKNMYVVVLAAVVLLLALARLTAYGNLRASIGTADTTNFVLASRLPLGSLDFFTSNRPPTIALVYEPVA